MDVSENIKGAIECDEVLTIKYNGGSKPGSVRQVLPLQILEDGKVRAKCLVTNRAKVFLIDKIEIVDHELRNSEQSWENTKVKFYSNIEEVYFEFKNKLEALGWHVVYENELENGNALHVYDRFKNGNLKKSPAGTLSFSEYVIEYDDETGKPYLTSKKRKIPYTFYAPNGDGTRLSSLAKCVDRFIAGAIEEAPNNK
ncbi:hypothetical protein [Alteromonas sp. M12]|uniref:hypothetical protein n=1 Tax=Alteromonas sp. M12 TaxID=3135644 RepID=UPI00319DBE76